MKQFKRREPESDSDHRTQAMFVRQTMGEQRGGLNRSALIRATVVVALGDIYKPAIKSRAFESRDEARYWV